jgi:hypothetical protein
MVGRQHLRRIVTQVSGKQHHKNAHKALSFGSLKAPTPYTLTSLTPYTRLTPYAPRPNTQSLNLRKAAITVKASTQTLEVHRPIVNREIIGVEVVAW